MGPESALFLCLRALLVCLCYWGLRIPYTFRVCVCVDVFTCVYMQVEEECPKCKYHRMSYYTMQMRSVDEGQTVFYTCLRCSYKFSTNT